MTYSLKPTGMLLVFSLLNSLVQAQEAPFYGLSLPGSATLQVLDFDQVDFPPLATGNPAEAAVLHTNLQRFVEIALASRERNPQRWGNFSGFPEEEAVIDYINTRFSQAGVEDIDIRRYDQAPWSLSTSWSLQLLSKGESVELQSAVPMGVGNRSRIEPLNAGLIYAGRGSAADLAGRDLDGKIAVIRGEVAPQFYDISTRNSTNRLAEAGAVGVILLWDTPGNMQVQLGNCPNISCFNLGGEDSAFLEAMLVKAAETGEMDELSARMEIDVEREVRGAINLVGRIPGHGNSEENIILIAHTDTWFGGADDNASGLAVLLGLTDYFSREGNRLAHDIYVVASPGHHHGAGGTAFFADNYSELLDNNMVTINLEHVASTGVSRIDAMMMDGVTDAYGNIANSMTPTNWDSPWHGVAMSDKTPFLVNAWQEAAASNMYTQPASVWEPAARSVPGEAAAVDAAGALVIQNVETSHWYHSSGATAETISPESLQRAYLFFRDIMHIIDDATKAEIRAR